MRQKVISLNLELELFKLIDTVAKKRFMSRSDYIRLAVVEKIERDNNVNCLTSGGQSVTIP